MMIGYIEMIIFQWWLIILINIIQIVLCLGGGDIIGSIIIYKSTCFQRDFFEKLTNEIIEMRIDDSYISYYLNQKKKKMAFITVNNLFDIIKPYNSIFPNSEGGRYSQENLIKTQQLINSIKFENEWKIKKVRN